MSTDKANDRPAVLWEGEVTFDASGGGFYRKTVRVVRRPRGSWTTPPRLAVEALYQDEMGAPRWSLADERDTATVMDAAVRSLAAALDDGSAQDAVPAPEGEPC